MDANQALLSRRKKYVANGLAMVTPIAAKSAKNALITDYEGREFIDFASGIGVTSAGHCPETVVEAIQRQAADLLHTCIMVATYSPYVDLCEDLAKLYPHGDETKVMLTTTGAESVENAIKIARQATGRSAVICFTGAFHGRTLLGMSLTSKVGYKVNCGPFAPEIYRLPFPDYYHHSDGLDLDSFVRRELDRLRDAFQTMVAGHSVAAIIIEPIQGEGGFISAPAAYMQGLRQICSEMGIMLIIDEVQSGFCRTGAWACYEHAGVTPDLSTWAKAMGSGMPIGCVIGRAEVMDAAAPGSIGGTYPGNPVTCAAAMATIAYMKEQDLNARAQRVGGLIRERFEALARDCPEVGDVRGMGAMMAMEFVRNGDPNQPHADFCGAVLAACWENGLLAIPAGTYKNIIRTLVPLTIEEETLSRGLDILEAAVRRHSTG